MDKHEKIVIYSYENILKKGLGKWFGCFWFLNHFLRWFLVVPPKDGFAHIPCTIALGCSLLQTFQYYFQKGKKFNKNYIELDNIVVVVWVDNTLDQAFSRKNIISRFKSIGIWPLDPKVMDERTRHSSWYIVVN
jgi:hypothetical protein